jgi:CBS domain containing-hemolysin-like protein
VAEAIFRPLTAILNGIGNLILRLAGLPPSDEGAKLISSEELAYIVEESSEGGLLDPEEQLYLENVLDFHERSVGQVMTPRTRMAALPMLTSLSEVMDAVMEQPHSRYPVYDGDRDNIVGILHVKDLARAALRPAEEFSLSKTMRPPVFVPETLQLEDMLTQFRRDHVQIAVVVDEYGGTAGIVTLEDLAEELIGEIQDEFDQEIEPFTEIAPRMLRVRGDLLLDEITQHYDIDFDEVEADTVGGLVMEQLGHVAEPGEEVTFGEMQIRVEQIDGLAVETAIITLPEPLLDGAQIQPLEEEGSDEEADH